MSTAASIPGGKWGAMLTGPLMAALILLLFWAVLFASLRDKSLTFDEGAYAAAGCSAWRLGDYRLNPEAGPLPQRVAGLPLALGPYRFPATGSAHWRNAQVQLLGYDFFFTLGNDARQMAGRGRAACGVLAALLGAVVWAWSRKLFGPLAGMISLALYVLNPTVLANGALMTSDMAAALFFAAATWSWWAVLDRMSIGRLAGSALLAGALFVSKMSAVLIVPVMFGLVIARLFDGRPLPVVLGRCRWELGSRVRQALAFAAAGVVHVLIVAVVIWGFYGFRFSAFASPAGQNHFQFSWEYVLGGGGLPMRAVDFMRRHEVLPESWLYGFGVILNRTQFGTAFWNGRYSTTGWPGFLPYTFLVKTPLSVFGVLGLAAAAGAAPRRLFYATLPLWVFLAVYWLAAIASHIDIGHRYLLPVYAPLFVLAGASARWFEGGSSAGACHGAAKRRRVPACAALCVLLALLAAETAWRFPNYLAYFNGIVRPDTAYRHLVDSSLDWGQDLPAATRYVDQHPTDGPFYQSYFGAGSPADYGVTARPLYSFGARYLEGFQDMRVVNLPVAGGAEELRRLEREEPTYDLMGVGKGEDGPFAVYLKKPEELRLAGGTYLISATMLQSVCDWEVHGPWNGRYETVYRQLEEEVQPLLSPSSDVRREFLRKQDVSSSRLLLYKFEQYRLARLTAYLRERSPDTTLNSSILVYRLTDADLVRALDEPIE